MSLSDFVFVLAIAAGGFLGTGKKISRHFFYFLRVGFSGFLSLHVYQPLGSGLASLGFIAHDIAECGAFASVFLGTFGVLSLVYLLIRLFLEIDFLPALNKPGGFVFGMLNAALLCLVVFFFLILLPVRGTSGFWGEKPLIALRLLPWSGRTYEFAMARLPLKQRFDPGKFETKMRNKLDRGMLKKSE